MARIAAEVWEKWSVEEVGEWLRSNGFDNYVEIFQKQKIDGETLANMTESDLLHPLMMNTKTTLHDVKKLQKKLHEEFEIRPAHLITALPSSPHSPGGIPSPSPISPTLLKQYQNNEIPWFVTVSQTDLLEEEDRKEEEKSTWKNGDKEAIPKLIFAIFYAAIVSFLTSFTMTVVHDRVVLHLGEYPPLPDVILDNITHVSWAFAAVETIILSLGVILAVVLVFHKHRLVVARRILIVAGNVFLLRCITMFGTTLSVPGTHLQCKSLNKTTFEEKLKYSWHILTNFGLHINGLTTCGDYMFSGHSSMLTLLNLAIIEYTPKSWKIFETFTWFLNIVGMFFVLAAHEHYTIDVVIAFVITTRLFDSFNNMANQWANKKKLKNLRAARALMMIFIYMIPLVEEHTDGVLPNEYEIPNIWPLSYFVKDHHERKKQEILEANNDKKKSKKTKQR